MMKYIKYKFHGCNNACVILEVIHINEKKKNTVTILSHVDREMIYVTYLVEIITPHFTIENKLNKERK